MKAILQRWNFMRIFRFALGLIIAVQGIATGQMVTAILSFLFAGMALAKIGCCGANGCDVDIKNSKKEKDILSLLSD